MIPASQYSFHLLLPLPFHEAEQRVRTALQKQQFGIISEVDIGAKLKEKLGIEHPAHIILGACNPSLAYQALQDNADVALALPCNVVLREQDGMTHVSAMKPTIALAPFQGRKVHEIASAAEHALEQTFDDLALSLSA